MAGSVDWKKAKSDYVHKNVSYQDIADKYGASKRTVIRQAQKGNWQAEKESYVTEVTAMCHQKTVEKVSEKTSDNYAEAVTTYKEMAARVQEKIFQTLAIDDAFSPRDLKALTGMLMDMKMALDIKPYDDGTQCDSNKTVIEFVHNDWD